jgi:hypothetical protein
MGIRVHKSIGFGLTDIGTRKTRGHGRVLDDPRINPRGYLGVPDDEREHERFSFERYVEFAAKFKWTMPTRAGRRRRRWSPDLENFHVQPGPRDEEDYHEQKLAEIKRGFPYFSVEHDTEYGMPEVLLVVPPAMTPEWRRYDEALDWCEETQCHGLKNRVIELKVPPYPWNPSREDLKTGDLLPGDEWCLASKDYADVPGTDWRWVVPAEVAVICKFLKLFKDDETIRNLKPLLYVWWS